MISGNEHSVQQHGEAMMERRNRVQVGDAIEPQQLISIHSERIGLPDSHMLTHLQFRRFAGCPVCDLHLHSIVRRHEEILATSIREVVVFHSSARELLAHAHTLPFAVIADPDKKLYRRFGVEASLCSLLDPRSWPAILLGIGRSMGAVLRGKEPLPALSPHGGRLGLPADFLIATNGRVLACKYGRHAYDQWSADEILTLAAQSQLNRTASYGKR